MPIPEYPWILPRGTCIVCHFFVPFKDMTIEHMIPRAQGGDGNESNLAPAHADCNVLKADRTLEEYMTFQAANQPRKKGQKKRKFEVLDYTGFPDVAE
jgi:5-methylcytosine-specific restriction endonuclease McrA